MDIYDHQIIASKVMSRVGEYISFLNESVCRLTPRQVDKNIMEHPALYGLKEASRSYYVSVSTSLLYNPKPPVITIASRRHIPDKFRRYTEEKRQPSAPRQGRKIFC